MKTSIVRVYGQWIVVTAMLAAMLFASAGRVDVPMFWVYLAVHSGAQLAMALLVFRRNRDLLEERQRPGQGAKAWDQVILRIYFLFTLALFVVAGLDVGRYHWSGLGLWSAVAGTVLFVLGSIVMTWAMLVNTHFEATVRIQRDRDHTVITGGPYRVVRQYSALIGSNATSPLDRSIRATLFL